MAGIGEIIVRRHQVHGVHQAELELLVGEFGAQFGRAQLFFGGCIARLCRSGVDIPVLHQLCKVGVALLYVELGFELLNFGAGYSRARLLVVEYRHRECHGHRFVEVALQRSAECRSGGSVGRTNTGIERYFRASRCLCYGNVVVGALGFERQAA